MRSLGFSMFEAAPDFYTLKLGSCARKKNYARAAKAMITQFFSIQDREMEPSAPTDSADLSVVVRQRRMESGVAGCASAADDEVVDQVVAAVMANVSKRKKCKTMVTETSLRAFVVNVVEERTPLLVPHAPNPSSPPPCTMPQLLHRFFATEQPSAWQSFYTATKSCFAPLVDSVSTRRKQQQVDTFFAGEGGDAAAVMKKKRSAVPLEPVPSISVILHDSTQPQPLDEWEMAHVVMRDQVLAVQQRTHSPRSSPTRQSGRRVTKLTESEQLQCSVLRASRFTAQHTGTDRITMLFRAFNADTSVPPANYDPPFDRNDLFFTNVAAARHLFSLEHKYSTAAMQRKQARESLQDLDCPAVHIVSIQYTGPLAAADMVTCVYVTWVLATDLATASPLSEASVFLEDVLSGRIRLNNMFTELVDRVARYSCHDGDLWKRRFVVNVLDSSGGAVCESNLPALVALVDTYGEQYGGVGKGKGADGKPLLGLNFVQHNHARHRLIFECGSVQTYRVVWQCNKNKDMYDAAHGKAVKVASVAVATVRLMWHKLVTVLGTSGGWQGTLTHVTPVVAELHSLAKLFLETAQQFEDAAREAHRAMCTYESSTEERKEKVKRSYATASVAESMDGCPVQSSIVSLFQSIQANPLGDVPPLHTLHGHASQVHQAKTLLMHAWFYICMPVPDVSWKKVFADHDEAAALKSVQVLDALTLLDLWHPAAWPEGGALPVVPPRQLQSSMITSNFRTTIRGTHCDKHVRDILEGKTSQSTQHELTQRVLHARQVLTDLFVDVTLDVTMASVT
jgi:hypothetical protein